MFEHPAKEVAKILRKLAKDNNIKASVRCRTFAWGNAVDVIIKKGNDTNVMLFNTFADQYGEKRKYNIDDTFITVYV